MSDCVILYCTVPDRDQADAIARRLVDERLAACVNLLPGMRACYRWAGETCVDDQVVLLAKTTAAIAATTTARIVELHGDEVPCVVQLPLTGGHAPFLSWIAGEVGPAAT